MTANPKGKSPWIIGHTVSSCCHPMSAAQPRAQALKLGIPAFISNQTGFFRVSLEMQTWPETPVPFPVPETKAAPLLAEISDRIPFDFCGTRVLP